MKTLSLGETEHLSLIYCKATKQESVLSHNIIIQSKYSKAN